MELFNEKGEAICQLCGESFNLITSTHLRVKHNTTALEYRQKYPEAPVASNSFKAKQKHRYNKVFDYKKEVDIEEIPEFSIDKIPDLKKELKPESKFLDEIKTFVIENIIMEYPDPNKIIPKDKLNILNFLLTLFQDVKNSDYITKSSISGFLEYRLITDICIPSKKIDIEFPESFWHNYDIPKYNRDTLLKRDGWIVIDIMGKRPSLEEIKKLIQDKITIKK